MLGQLPGSKELDDTVSKYNTKCTDSFIMYDFITFCVHRMDVFITVIVEDFEEKGIVEQTSMTNTWYWPIHCGLSLEHK